VRGCRGLSNTGDVGSCEIGTPRGGLNFSFVQRTVSKFPSAPIIQPTRCKRL
jgi:hypothetical protein